MPQYFEKNDNLVEKPLVVTYEIFGKKISLHSNSGVFSKDKIDEGTFAFLKVNLIFSVAIIGIVTFIISMCGVKIGNVFGDKYESKAEITGGIILILLGLKILLEHLGILVF